MKQILLSGTKDLGLSLSEIQVNRFLHYLELLVEWNQKFNLTAIKDPEEIVVKHFLDSLLLAPFIKSNCKLADVGTGAGFPGIPLKILYDGLQVTLIDSLGKRVSFLQEVLKQLQLDKVEAIHTRVEDIAHKGEFRERFDVVVTRAVSKMSVIAEYCLPLVKVDGQFLAAKGPNIRNEMEESGRSFLVLGGRLARVEDAFLPGRNDARTIVVVNKVKNTPKQYPRKAGVPERKPIEGT